MAKLKLNPLADRVVVKPAEAEEKTKGGIFLPDTAKEKPVEGTVVAAGPGKFADSGEVIKMTVKVGDKVLYGKYSGTEVTIDGEEYLIMRESDIFAIVP
ncbi:MAG TPA: co-chaperone GroES [Ignavibacteriaceae bacterium]|nr:co-chaperone GroES [Ignavibacteriaceae bacterium]